MGRKENNIAHIKFLCVKEKRPAARLRQHHLAEAGLRQKQGIVMNNTQRKLRANRNMCSGGRLRFFSASEAFSEKAAARIAEVTEPELL